MFALHSCPSNSTFCSLARFLPRPWTPAQGTLPGHTVAAAMASTIGIPIKLLNEAQVRDPPFHVLFPTAQSVPDLGAQLS